MEEKSKETQEQAVLLSRDAARLLAEADTALSSNAFAILNNQTRSTIHRLYEAASLRHCCVLLQDIEKCSEAGQEIVVRILARVFMEAWFIAMYIHFGGWTAFERVAQETAYQSGLVARAFTDYDKRLMQTKKIAKRKGRAVAKANAGISTWNETNPAQPKELHVPPYIPTLNPTGIDVSRRVTKDLKDVEQKHLTIEEVTRQLSALGPTKGFAQETFEPLYLWYRVFSAGSVHATLNVYDTYYRPGNFDRIAPAPADTTLVPQIRVTALYCTALIVQAVLNASNIHAPVAAALLETYEPDPSQSSWWPNPAANP